MVTSYLRKKIVINYETKKIYVILTLWLGAQYLLERPINGLELGKTIGGAVSLILNNS